MNIELPPTIAAFFQAFNAHDTDAVSALFAGDALVADEGREYHGTDAIKGWIEKANASYKPHADPFRPMKSNQSRAVVLRKLRVER